MYIQPNRHSEADRLAALATLNVLDTPRESPLDRLVFIAAQALRAPMAGLVLVDAERQWFKSRVGISATHFPRHESLCTHAIQSADPMIVEDTAADIRFSDNPLVTGPPFIRFYAGAPLIGPDAFRVGTLCVFDNVARAATASQVRLLVQLAQEAANLLMARLVDESAGPGWPGYTTDA